MPPARRHCRRTGAHYSHIQVGRVCTQTAHAHTIHDARTTTTGARDHYAALAGGSRRSSARAAGDTATAPGPAARQARPARPPTGHLRAAPAAACRGRSRCITAAAPPLPAATPPARPPPSMGWVELSCTAGHRKPCQALSVEGWESADQWRKRDAQWNKPAPVSRTMGSSRGNAPAVGMSATTGRMPKLASRSEARMSSVLLTIALSRSAQTCNSEVYV